MSQKELTGNDTEKLHFFTHSTDGITLPSVFTYPFHYTPHPLTQLAAREVQAYLSERKEWEEELHQGKMFGVLVVRTPDNRTGYLAAFSGNLAGSNSHPFFVPPVYDLLQPVSVNLNRLRNISRRKKSCWTYRKPATGN